MVGLGLRLELALGLELAYDWFRLRLELARRLGLAYGWFRVKIRISIEVRISL